MDDKKYIDFVDGKTSIPSKDLDELIKSLRNLQDKGIVSVPRLLTAQCGLSGEVGEFCDIVKKLCFQGKELTPELKKHMIKELGDIFWYAYQACLALDVSAEEIKQTNYDKLSERYKGQFTIEQSENRKSGDV